MSDSIIQDRNVVVEMRVAISPAGLLSIAAIVLAGAVVTGVAIREAKRPARPRLKKGADKHEPSPGDGGGPPEAAAG